MTDLPRTPSFRLDGRRALVTGAGRAIGLAAAAALAEAGAEVTLVARTANEIEAAAAAIVATGGKAVSAVLDVSDLDAVAAFFAARPAFHVLVNNAGTNRPKPMWEVTEADFDAVYDLNVKLAFFVAQACARGMIAGGIAGSLIHMGSQMGHVGGAGRSLYCRSKWALEGMNKAFALDPFSDTFLGDPYRHHDALRDAEPVVFLPAVGCFAMLRYAEVGAALKDWPAFVSGRGVGLADFAREAPWRPPSLLPWRSARWTR